MEIMITGHRDLKPGKYVSVLKSLFSALDGYKHCCISLNKIREVSEQLNSGKSAALEIPYSVVSQLKNNLSMYGFYCE